MKQPDRLRRTLLLALGALAAGAVVLGVIVLRDDDAALLTEGTGTSETSTTTDSTTTSAAARGIDAATPLGPRGVGPIEAGMTVSEANAATGLALTPHGVDLFGGLCFNVTVEDQPDLWIRVHSPDGEPVGDPGEGVISSIEIYALDPDGPSTRKTTAGLGLGASEAAVRAVYGDAIDEEPAEYVPEGVYLYVYPDDEPGFGIRYVLDENRIVTSIDVGDAEDIKLVEGCS